MVYMCAICGDLKAARILCDGILCKDVISWTMIIMAYAIHGLGKISIQFFLEMKERGMNDASTFVSLLSHCSISGMVD